MSGWFYKIRDAKQFLGFKAAEKEYAELPEEKKFLVSLYSEGREFNESEFAKEV